MIAKSMNTASRAVADEGEVRPLAELGLSCCSTLVRFLEFLRFFIFLRFAIHY